MGIVSKSTGVKPKNRDADRKGVILAPFRCSNSQTSMLYRRVRIILMTDDGIIDSNHAYFFEFEKSVKMVTTERK